MDLRCFSRVTYSAEFYPVYNGYCTQNQARGAGQAGDVKTPSGATTVSGSSGGNGGRGGGGIHPFSHLLSLAWSASFGPFTSFFGGGGSTCRGGGGGVGMK